MTNNRLTLDKLMSALKNLPPSQKMADLDQIVVILTPTQIDKLKKYYYFIGSKIMKTYQQRVIDEKKALDKKLDKLFSFITTPEYSALQEAEKLILYEQSTIMKRYSNVLTVRIALFNKVE